MNAVARRSAPRFSPHGRWDRVPPADVRDQLRQAFARWGLPLILCARTSLGTINHTLLSVEAIRARAIPLTGIAFIGYENRESETIIIEKSGAKRLGRLPRLDPLNRQTLGAAFAANFRREDFA